MVDASEIVCPLICGQGDAVFDAWELIEREGAVEVPNAVHADLYAIAARRRTRGSDGRPSNESGEEEARERVVHRWLGVELLSFGSDRWSG